MVFNSAKYGMDKLFIQLNLKNPLYCYNTTNYSYQNLTEIDLIYERMDDSLRLRFEISPSFEYLNISILVLRMVCTIFPTFAA